MRWLPIWPGSLAIQTINKHPGLRIACFDHRCANSDWNAAIERYADQHDRHYQALHAVETWFTALAWDQGPEADARRLQIFPKLEQPGAPDIIGLGPDSPADERALV